MTFGKMVKEFRLKHELILRELSEMTGLTAAAICQIENHNRDPQFKTALVLIQRLQIPVGQLLRLEW